MTILFVLKSREVATLKKQCEDLSETMRMMRYEEANLSRMLHTANKPAIQQPAVVAEEDAQKTLVPTENMATPICDEVPVKDEGQQSEQVEEIAEEHIDKHTDEQEIIQKKIEESIQGESSTSHKQAINERRPAIPTDLFAAWFAENEENEDTVPKEPTTESPEKEKEVQVILTGKDETPSPSQPLSMKVAETTIEVVVETVVEPVRDITSVTSIAAAPPPKETTTVVEVSNTDTPIELSKEDERFCRKLERIVNTRLRNPNLNIDIIAAQFGIGRTNFYRKVRELTGISPNDYLRKCRMERAAELLCNSELPVNDVCAQVGIPDAQYFSRVFKAYFGISPSVYRENHNQ